MQQQFLFSDVNELVNYLFRRFGKLSPLKLQKGLYFLYAYYGATYGVEQQDGVLEEDYNNMPERLFDAEFEAWTYGPVIREVYNNYKSGVYDAIEIDEDEEELDQDNFLNREARLFIDEMFEQINSVSDFSLVDRSHEDKVWQVAYRQGKSTVMDNESIIEEYKEKYV